MWIEYVLEVLIIILQIYSDISSDYKVLEKILMFIIQIRKTRSFNQEVNTVRNDTLHIINDIRSILCGIKNYLGHKYSLRQYLESLYTLHKVRRMDALSRGLINSLERDYIVMKKSVHIFNVLVKKYVNKLKIYNK